MEVIGVDSAIPKTFAQANQGIDIIVDALQQNRLVEHWDPTLCPVIKVLLRGQIEFLRVVAVHYERWL